MSEKRPRGNPNFTKGHRIGVLLNPPMIEGEKTFPLCTRVPESLKAQFDELPGSVTQKLRQAIELLIAQHQEAHRDNQECS